jgi:hypothetical protein
MISIKMDRTLLLQYLLAGMLSCNEYKINHRILDGLKEIIQMDIWSAMVRFLMK